MVAFVFSGWQKSACLVRVGVTMGVSRNEQAAFLWKYILETPLLVASSCHYEGIFARVYSTDVCECNSRNIKVVKLQGSACGWCVQE